jgi:PKD repeat protein
MMNTPGSVELIRVAALVAVAAAAACGWTCAAPGASKLVSTGGERAAFAVSLAAPSAGDVSYGIARVQVDPGARVPALAGQLVFADRIGGLAVAARSPAWSELRRSTRVYVVVSGVAGGSAVRDVAFFIVRRQTGSAPRQGEVSFSIANARAATGSFWVRAVDRHGYADIFHVRNLLATAVGNWTRYLSVLRAARALAAAVHPLELGRVGRTRADGPGAQPGTPARLVRTGGQPPTRRARALLRLLLDAVTDPSEYAAAKTNPRVLDFIVHDLNNPSLARRWRAVTGRLPLTVPDRFAAAAQEEALFTQVHGPRIDHARVAIADGNNSSSQAGGDLTQFATTLTVLGFGDGRITGRTFADGQNIDCPKQCEARFLTGQEWETLTATPPLQITSFSWVGCDEVTPTNECRVLVGGHDRTISVSFTVAFARGEVLVSFGGNGSGTVTSSPFGIDCLPTCDSVFTPGTRVTLTAAAGPDSVFTGWTPGSCDTVSGDTCQLTVTDQGAFVGALFATRLRASFSASPSPASPEQPVIFTAASNAPDHTIVGYHWEFGDGHTADTTTGAAIHIYDCTGTVDATLTVTDSTGQTASTTSPLTVTSASGFGDCSQPHPIASFTVTPNPGPAGGMFTFDATSSRDPAGRITTYFWEFPDRSNTPASSPTITRPINCQGNRIVTLTVIDDRGLSDVATLPITIQDSPPGYIQCPPP